MSDNASKNLKNTVRDHVTDPRTQALVFHAEMEPVAGPGVPIAPPTYASPSQGDKNPHFAYSPRAFVPERNADGWFMSMERTSDGSPRLAPRVTVDSVSSQTGRCETALWKQQERLGIKFPGILVQGTADGLPQASNLAEQELRDSLAIQISTWDMSHRQVDAIVKYAQTASGQQVWEDDSPGSIKDLIVSSNPSNANKLFSHFLFPCIGGYWLSGGTAQRHKLPRAYSSEIVGYGAHEITTGSTKLDAFGGAPADLKVEVKNNQLAVSAKGRNKPSDLGLGQVPTSPKTHGFACELILQQASLSLAVLRSLRFETKEQSDAALTALTLLAMAGHLLAQEDGFLRSGCSLITVDSRWGWRSSASGRSITELPVPTLDEVTQALRAALDDAASEGLELSEPVELTFSAAQREIITKRVEKERTKAMTEEKE